MNQIDMCEDYVRRLESIKEIMLGLKSEIK